MKKMLLTLLGVLLALPGIARDFTYEYEGQTLTYTVIDEDAKTCKTKDGKSDNVNVYPGNSVSGVLEIPSIAKDGDVEYSVTKIGDLAFSYCSGLTSVTIPNSVTTIGNSAFEKCSGLTSVIIPNSVTEIGNETFYRCTGLTSVTIPNSVTTIGQEAFRACSGLTSVTIPNSVISIGDYAFSGCEGLTSVIIGNSVISIGRGAFYGCYGMTSVAIGSSVTSIGEYAFSDCTQLKKSAYPSGLSNPFSDGTSIQYPREGTIIEEGFVYGPEKNAIYFAPLFFEGEYIIPNSVNSIGNYAFSDCSGLTSVTIPNSVNSIGVGAFSGCSGLTSVTIPNSVNSIGEYAFSGCSGLTSVTIPNSVTKIDYRAFSNCSSLTSVTIPNSVNSIGVGAFSGCSGLGTFTIEDGQSLIAFDGALNNANIEHLYIGRNWSYFNMYGGSAFPSKTTTVEIGNSVTELPAYAFYGCSGMKSVTMPNSVTTIGNSAFEKCSGLTSVIIPNSVNSIGNKAFYDCYGLKKSAYPSGLSNPFCYLDSYGYTDYGISIQYPREDVIIEDGFVYGPEKNAIYFAPYYLEGEYVIPEYVTKIGAGAFQGCSDLTSVTIPNSVTTIRRDAFADCSGLTSVTIPNSVTSIGNYAFYGCSGMTSVKATAMIPPLMDDGSFYGLYATAALSVPVEATTDYLATNWSLFKNLRMGDSEAACQTYETGNLKYMLIPGKTDADKNLAVVIPGDYSSLTEVTIPERFTVTSDGENKRYYVDAIGYKAFDGCSNLATVTFNSRNTAKAIGDYAFNLCSSLTGIVIPGSVKTIGDYAFYCTSAIKDVTLNEGLESIGNHAFYAKEKRSAKPIYIPSTLKSIGEDAFYNFNCAYVNISDLASWCNIDFADIDSNPAQSKYLYLNGEKIENLVIPETVAEVKAYAFRDIDGLKSVVFNDALQSIGASAFSVCSELESVVFNDALQSIGASAFYSCSGLKSVVFNDALQNIGRKAFYDCYSLSLSGIVIPGNVTSIGDEAFYPMYHSLTFAYGAEPIEIGSNAFPAPFELSWDRPIEGMNLDVNNLKTLTIGNSVTEIPANMFKDAAKLTDLTLGNSLTAIGDEAFSGCTALTEVILPPSVETIGASAFDGNSKLTSIIMGHKVTTIGEKAYNLCPAQTVSITAQTPPTAPDNTFSNYTGSLYVQGQTAADAYYDADYCWYQFEGHVMIEPTEMKVEGDKTLNGKPGDTFQLIAKLYPDDVTLPQIFWRSTNPDIATVDANGLVTLHADLSEVMTMAEGDDDATARSCKIIAESLYADGPVAEFTVEDVNSSVISAGNDSNDGAIDYSAPYEVYSINGMKVADTTDDLAPGIYIIRQGKNVEKVALH